MTFKSKIIILSSVIGALSLAFILTIVFDNERVQSRFAAHSWLETWQRNEIGGIILESNLHGRISLERRDGDWVVLRGGVFFPARQQRVEDLISLLTRRAAYRIISSSASAHERLAVDGGGNTASITVTDRGGRTMLALLIGNRDATGRNIYLRRQDLNEVRSGEDLFTGFLSLEPSAWFNLRLFPESETGELTVTSVQRLTVFPSLGEDEEETGPFVFTRSGRGWAFNFHLNDPNMGRVDSYIQDILITAGSDFADHINPDELLIHDSSIVLEFGDGTTRTVRFSRPFRFGPGEPVIRYATVSKAGVPATDLVYVIPEWAYSRIFQDISVFER